MTLYIPNNWKEHGTQPRDERGRRGQRAHKAPPHASKPGQQQIYEQACAISVMSERKRLYTLQTTDNKIETIGKFSQKTSDSLKKLVFFICFSPFYAQERIASIALCSFALFLRATWAICFHGSVQKSDCAQFTQVAHDERETGLICSFSRANHSFSHKKLANR